MSAFKLVHKALLRAAKVYPEPLNLFSLRIRFSFSLLTGYAEADVYGQQIQPAPCRALGQRWLLRLGWLVYLKPCSPPVPGAIRR
mmetsp:Transcript_11410/g.29237  ORF Transcript_11410/g.29237 Transcript_11410/m.29237 type:complete len:85 (+) Transcript_11410:207-461(+)